MTTLTTRLATIGDAPAIARIDNEGIADRIATFDTEPRTAEQVEVEATPTGATEEPP